jgi:elongation factor P
MACCNAWRWPYCTAKAVRRRLPGAASGHGKSPARPLPKVLARVNKIAMLRAATLVAAVRARQRGAAATPAWLVRLDCPAAPPMTDRGIPSVKVIASSLRKGNIVELDDRLYVVLTAENIHPGKGTPVTQIDMRRLSDGVKSSLRFKTTDQVERAHVEDREFQYLYQDGDGFHFMNMENYEQIALSEDIIGEQSGYLQPEMKVRLSIHEGTPVGIELPPRVTLEVVETEPVTKGQTAASSYKPAVLSNGMRTSVPPHIVTGTRIVVSTVDGSYVERAKD